MHKSKIFAFENTRGHHSLTRALLPLILETHTERIFHWRITDRDLWVYSGSLYIKFRAAAAEYRRRRKTSWHERLKRHTHTHTPPCSALSWQDVPAVLTGQTRAPIDWLQASRQHQMFGVSGRFEIVTHSALCCPTCWRWWRQTRVDDGGVLWRHCLWTEL